ncbi:hypothetical protein AB1Y20_020446 [Prymnesium parvum]|uniref:Uncharacterized protein n=1 Tax=Prymnesium parvum TaxID=97485 RepID=A0AB34JWX5_PRYPA
MHLTRAVHLQSLVERNMAVMSQAVARLLSDDKTDNVDEQWRVSSNNQRIYVILKGLLRRRRTLRLRLNCCGIINKMRFVQTRVRKVRFLASHAQGCKCNEKSNSSSEQSPAAVLSKTPSARDQTPLRAEGQRCLGAKSSVDACDSATTAIAAHTDASPKQTYMVSHQTAPPSWWRPTHDEMFAEILVQLDERPDRFYDGVFAEDITRRLFPQVKLMDWLKCSRFIKLRVEVEQHFRKIKGKEVGLRHTLAMLESEGASQTRLRDRGSAGANPRKKVWVSDEGHRL